MKGALLPRGLNSNSKLLISSKIGDYKSSVALGLKNGLNSNKPLRTSMRPLLVLGYNFSKGMASDELITFKYCLA